jgi:TonB family protein
MTLLRAEETEMDFAGFSPAQMPLIDPFGRSITYLRVSVTDRCDFRCVCCMAENMTFLPKRDLLTLEELDRLCSAFIAKGVRKIRLTGGEPLVRRGLMTLFASLSRHLASGALGELTLTTNGSQLPRFAGELAAHGVKRINVSLDTRDPEKFRAITRWGELRQALDGIAAARAAGMAVKINAVALLAQLERNKRYPPAAGGAQGTARLAFRIDRRGHLLESHITQSSGSAALDEETLALARRAQPFPSPPADATENQLSFVVPIRYAASARR